MIDNNGLMDSERVDVADYSALECVRVPLLSKIAYNSIRDGISSGQVKPGEWLRQDTLAQKLGVISRGSARYIRYAVLVGGFGQ